MPSLPLLLDLPSLEQVIDHSPITISADTLLIDAITLMSQAQGSNCTLPDLDSSHHPDLSDQIRCSCLLVMADTKPIGIITERDVVKATVSGVNLDRVRVAEVMSRDLISLTLTESQTILTAFNLLKQHQIRHLPILDSEGDLIGLVTPNRIRQALQPIHLFRFYRVAEVMTTQVTHAPKTASLLDIAQIMADSRDSCVVITERQGELSDTDDDDLHLTPLGIITERDIVQFRALELNFGQIQAESVMSTPLFCLHSSDSLWAAQQQMRARFVQRLVVTDERGKLTGIVAQTSLFQVLDPLEITSIVEVLHHQIEDYTVEIQQVNWHLQQEVAERQKIEFTLQNQQQQLQSAYEEMERQVADRTAALEQANISLQESEHRYKTLIEASPVGIFWFDAEGQCTYVNQRWSEITGRPAEAAMGNGWLETIHSDDQEPTLLNWNHWVQASDRESQYRNELRTVRPDGSIVWTYCLMLRDLDPNGNLLGYVGSLTDITQSKQAEINLQTQIQREQLLAKISLDIRRSLELNDVLSQMVKQVRELLNADRVFIYRFHPDWRGTIVVESVSEDYPSAFEAEIADQYFLETQGEDYRQGRIQAVADVDIAGLSQCHLDMLTQFQIKANLAVPILQGERLWGLLVANQCSAPRQWQPLEIDLLKQLSNHLGIAIQQSELYEQTRQELFEHERMQAVLEASEQRFRTLSAAAPIGICQTNADGICLYTNARWQEMSGLSLADSLGRSWLETIHPDDRQAFTSAWNACIQGEGHSLPDCRILASTGEIRWVSAQVSAMRSFSDEVIGYVITVEDITERKQAETIIREQAVLLDIASDAFVVRDLANQILYWNKGAERLYGWTAEEAIGQNAFQLLYKAPSSSPSEMNNILENGEWQGELQQVTKTGQEITVNSRWTLVRDEANNPKFILEVNTDITEKKQLEAQFLRAQRLESIGTLAGGIAHDLNNMLTPILVSAQLLQMQFSEGRPHELLRMMESNARRGADLVKQVLTFARGTEVRRVPLQPKHLLSEVLQVCHHTFPKTITISLDAPAELAMISADPTQIQQVFMNLCVNARDAMPDGGHLRLSAENFVADETYSRMHPAIQAGSYVLITIADTGTGMSAEVLDRIFDPFFTTKAVGVGTGLGLSVVQGIVHSHGGLIEVNSKVAEGTQFRVYLPSISASASQPDPSPAIPLGQGELILVTDDEADILQITKAVLETNNYQVITAYDGIEAVAHYIQHRDKISVVLMDMMMPAMSGETAIQTLIKINPRVKIIASSGLPLNQFYSSIERDIQASLPKPYTAQELLTTLHQVISANNS
jgi:PAS domain S-box-containing protein